MFNLINFFATQSARRERKRKLLAKRCLCLHVAVSTLLNNHVTNLFIFLFDLNEFSTVTTMRRDAAAAAAPNHWLWRLKLNDLKIRQLIIWLRFERTVAAVNTNTIATTMKMIAPTIFAAWRSVWVFSGLVLFSRCEFSFSGTTEGAGEMHKTDEEAKKKNEHFQRSIVLSSDF